MIYVYCSILINFNLRAFMKRDHTIYSLHIHRDNFLFFLLWTMPRTNRHQHFLFASSNEEHSYHLTWMQKTWNAKNLIATDVDRMRRDLCNYRCIDSLTLDACCVHYVYHNEHQESKFLDFGIQNRFSTYLY